VHLHLCYRDRIFLHTTASCICHRAHPQDSHRRCGPSVIDTLILIGVIFIKNVIDLGCNWCHSFRNDHTGLKRTSVVPYNHLHEKSTTRQRRSHIQLVWTTWMVPSIICHETRTLLFVSQLQYAGSLAYLSMTR